MHANHTNTPILLIGSGRLAKHLKYWNSLLKQPNELLLWDRTQSLDLLKEYLNKSHMVWLAISDSAIRSFYESHLVEENAANNNKIVHFSGALNDKRFLCAHPLMSFPHHLLPDEVYAKIHFVISDFKDLNEALPGFKNHFSVLSAENKSLYHALCVAAGNFPQLIWHEVSLQMKNLTLPEEALDLYIKQITDNYLSTKENSITGPFVRKDYTTIENNLTSLTQSNQSEKLKNIYTTFTKEFAI